MRLSRLGVLSGLLSLSWAGTTVQKPGLVVPPVYAARLNDTKALFVESYEAYRKYAWGHDDLAPLSKGFVDSRNGWGSSVVDAMSTMVSNNYACSEDGFKPSCEGHHGIERTSSLTPMRLLFDASPHELQEYIEEAVNYTSTIDFTQSRIPGAVSVFETTIRYLGGLLSSYELSGKKYQVLVDKAREVADKMAFAWVGDSVIPFGFVDFDSNTPLYFTSNIAEAGTLSLEWYLLSKYTKNTTYADLSVAPVIHIANLPSPLPGLAAQGINPVTGEFIGGYVTWGAASDSYFEYLVKYARLTNTDNSIFIDTWKACLTGENRSLAKCCVRPPLTLRSGLCSKNRRLETLRISLITTTARFGLSARMSPGHVYAVAEMELNVLESLGLFPCRELAAGFHYTGGRLLNNQTIVDIALELNEGCWNSYASTATGIGPEAFAFISTDSNATDGSVSEDQLKFYSEHGFYITNSKYVMRPEVLESNFHAWRVTGDTKYLDRAGDAIDSFFRYLPAPVAYAPLVDVNNATGGLIDDMESFWFAEVLKYLYLTFDDPDNISLDKYVFNTECQPFEAPPALKSYDTPGRLTFVAQQS
ncbi:unnamed protein product [Mycena citricolor]|uniref:alpha-1,2-Mannosidase n=1 Tax=Mycena citricolor TaxID=2018698 RepID=A0AAD2GQ76_9AGAR|nr:unnamed protein product [Mycena citricolor]